MKIYSKRKTILSWILTICFVAASLYVPVISYQAKALEIPTKYGTNLLSGVSMNTYYSTDGSTRTAQSDNGLYTNINDGNVATKFFLGTPKFAENVGGSWVWHKDGSKVFLDLQFDMRSPKTVKALYMLNDENPVLRTGRFKLYLSENLDDLYTDEKLVKDYVNTQNLEEVVLELSTPVDARYMAVRILFPVATEITSDPTTGYTRIKELAVFGDKKADSAHGENIIKGTKPNAFYTTDGGTTMVSCPDNGLFSKLTDMNAGTKFFSGTPKFAEEKNGNKIYYKDGSERWLDLEFFLAKGSIVKAFEMVNDENPVLRTQRFKLYLSEKYSDLYKEESLVIDYNNDSQEIVEYVLPEAKNADYAAIRILNPVSADVSDVSIDYTRIREISIFGEKPKGNVTFSESFYKASDKVLPELKAKNNLLYNKEYHKFIQMSSGEDTTANGVRWLWNNPSALTNGIANDQGLIPGPIYYNEDGTPKENQPFTNASTYSALTYYLGGEAKVDSIWLYNHSNKNASTYAYGVYLSKSLLSLYEEESLVQLVINESNSSLHKFDFEEPAVGCYIGIKIYIPVHPESVYEGDSAYGRLSQIAAFGTLKASAGGDPFGLNYDSMYSKYQYNALKGIIPTVAAYDGSSYIENEPVAPEVTDEVFDNQFEDTTMYFGEYSNGTVTMYNDRYVDYTFDMKSEVKAEAIVVTHHPAVRLRTEKYELYGSNDKDKLFTEDSLLEVYENTAKDRVNTFESVGKKFRYFGIRVLDPYCGDVAVTENLNEAYVRLSDVALFGDYTDPSHRVNNVDTLNYLLSNKEFASFGKNLVSKVKTPKWMFNRATLTNAYPEASKLLTDGDLSKHGDFTHSPDGGNQMKLITTDGSNILDMQYTLDAIYDFSGFALVSAADMDTAYHIGWYQVYIAEEADDLFLEENMVFEYNWLKTGSARGHHVVFDNYTPRGQVVGVRILNPVTSATEWIIPRLSEFAVYGKKAVIEIKPTNLAANMPVEAYSQSKSGKLTSLSESNLTIKEIKNLTDMNLDTTAQIKTTNPKIQLLYNLCNDVVLSELKLQSTAKAYKIYASDDINKIWDKDTLIYTYTGRGTNGKKITTNKKYRYVRFEIYNFSSPVTIKEVSIIGGDNQLLKYKKVSRSFKPTGIALGTYNVETKKRNFIKTPGNIEKIYDGDLQTSVRIEGGKDNEEYLDLLITFDDIKNIDGITLNFPSMHRGYNPSKVEIYTSESLGDFDEGEFDNPVVVGFNDFPKNGVYNATFRPRFARIMLVRFLCGDTEYNGYDYMCYALNELTIHGTNVVGMQPDENEDTLLEFKDKKTGITAEILKYDNNDVFTTVTGIKVKEKDATFDQKKQVAEIGSLKIIKEKAYTVEFINNAGDTVTDLGGRTYMITMPYDPNEFEYPTMIATDGEKKCKAVNAAVSDGVAYYKNNTFEYVDYMLSSFLKSDDPYFDSLNVEVPEIDSPLIPEDDNNFDDVGEAYPEIGDNNVPNDGSELGDLDIDPEIGINDGSQNDADDGFVDPFDNNSPETGERAPIGAFVLAVFSSAVMLSVLVHKRKKRSI